MNGSKSGIEKDSEPGPKLRKKDCHDPLPRSVIGTERDVHP